jgi:hypothetical protein
MGTTGASAALLPAWSLKGWGSDRLVAWATFGLLTEP